MMYNQKLVASLKANGKILREFKDTVYIPFGSEYSILLKNLHTARAVVHVYIDGDDMVPGGVVLSAGQEVDLERSVKNGNLTEGNKFKFIERSGAVEAHRGTKLEDGLIRIEYQYEKHPMQSFFDANQLLKQYPPGVRGFNNHATFKSSEYQGVIDKFSAGDANTWLQASGATYATTNVSQMNVGGALRGVDYSKNGGATAQAASAAIHQVSPNTSEIHDGSATMDWNDVGITVPGSKSSQKFTHVTMGVMETEKHSIVLKILGETPDNKPVLKSVTVERKPKCVTCGKQNKAHAKFCTECGTSLEIFA